MKINKEVRRSAKQLFRACFVDDQFDLAKARSLVDSMLEAKPRHYLSILSHFGRLVRLEAEKRTAIVETARKLDAAVQEQVKRDIARKFPEILKTEFQVDPAFLGGMRIRVGSDVWDGTISGKLEALRSALN